MIDMRCIDADKLQKDISLSDSMTDDYGIKTGYAICMRLIDKQPTIEPGRKKGEWIYGEHDVAMCDGYWCDQCGFFVPWDYQHKSIDFIKDYNLCPSCGADMRGEGDADVDVIT